MVPDIHQLMSSGNAKKLPPVWGVHLALAGSAFLLLFTGGCEGTRRVPVSGGVFIDGKPLTTGTIRFVPASGRAATALIEEDGSFSVVTKSLAASGADIVGLEPGSYRLAVLASEAPTESEDAAVRWLAPRRYADFRTSGLEVDIQEPTDKLVVDLTWEGAEETDEKTETEAARIKEEN